ncbi:MAG: TIGR03084 family protein [Rhodobacteraceae bacterium]|nr:MAG: TIGR03084 family protein [Paracoccaceae bacterium]
MQEARDFHTETHVLAAALTGLTAADHARPTLFKGWSIDDILGHLHIFNAAAGAALQGEAQFQSFAGPILRQWSQGVSILDSQRGWIGNLAGPALRDAWLRGAQTLADAFAAADPKARLAWFGPSMSARSSITARQMETWAHGQAIFDLLGCERPEDDRLRNIAHLGVVTIPFAFRNRGEEPPDPPPHVRLTAPSGAVWTWNDPDAPDRLDGSALAFCQTAAQTRAAADTDLRATGPGARRWLEIAQCFAGPPNDPPQPGARRRSVP